AGPPDPLAANHLREELNRLLVHAQYGTKIGERGVRRKPIKRLIEQGVRHFEIDIEPLMQHYNWLCDAVHPSYGFQTAYTTRLLLHNSHAQLIEEAGRGVKAAPGADETEPTVAIAAVELATSALEALGSAFPQCLAMVDDYGLTTGVSFASRLDYWRRYDK